MESWAGKAALTTESCRSEFERLWRSLRRNGSTRSSTTDCKCWMTKLTFSQIFFTIKCPTTSWVGTRNRKNSSSTALRRHRSKRKLSGKQLSSKRKTRRRNYNFQKERACSKHQCEGIRCTEGWLSAWIPKQWSAPLWSRATLEAIAELSREPAPSNCHLGQASRCHR